ncbi:transcription initiation factor TFIID subunit 4 [Cebidichthys violaceus]|uniref:transcription initiation factor TFIID subunit 4 n=1 Tax=Cebidichthys violaceus TaxID=271503 RepID=UPI0035C9F337
MAGASDPLEDMLFTEVDEKAVSDLVGSLESQLGDRKASPAASYSGGKPDGAPRAAATAQFSGKVLEDPVDPVRSVEPQQGRPREGLDQDPGPTELLSGKVLLSSSGSSTVTSGATPPTISPVPGPVTLTTRSSPAAGSSPATVTAVDAIRTASPGLQSLNGSVKLVNSVPAAAAPPPPGTSTVISTVSTGGSAIIASQPHFTQTTLTSPAVSLQRHPGPVNGVDPKGPQVVTHSSPLMHTTTTTKMLVQSQPVSGSSVILTGTPPPAAQTPMVQTGTSTAAVTLKPAVNGVGQPSVSVVRPPGAPVVTTSIQQQQQRPGLVAPRAAAPQLAVRPQQQTTIQLPPGFSMPPGMVLVRTETGQLVMVPQQVLAQAQAKTQLSQAVANISQRPATPTAGTAIRVSTAPTAPQTVRLASPAQTRMVQPPSTTTVQVCPPSS